MKKVIYFSPHDLPGSHISRNFDYARRLVKRGYSVTIIVNNFSHRDKKRLFESGESFFYVSSCENVRVVWVNTTKYKTNGFGRALNAFSYFLLSVWFTLRESERYDIYIGDSVPPTAGMAACLTSYFGKGNFFYQVRDVWPAALVFDKAIRKYSLIYAILRCIEKMLYKRATGIISTVPFLSEHVLTSGGDPKKIFYLPNGANLDVFSYRERSRPNNNLFRVTYAGGFGNAHDVFSIIRAANILNNINPEIFFDFYGDGQNLKKSKDMVEQLRLSNVSFNNSLSKSELSKRLSDSDLLIAALTNSDSYKFGINLNKLYDYFSVGRPIVLAIRSSHNPVMDACCGLIVPPENPEMIADAVLKIFNMSQEERNVLGANGRAFAEKNYDLNMLDACFDDYLRQF